MLSPTLIRLSRTLPLALSAGTLLATAPLSAADVTLRLQGQVVSSSTTTIGLTGDFGTGPGAYLGAEFRLNDRFGIEVGAAWAELEETEVFAGEFSGSTSTASITFNPVTVAFNIHLTPQKRFDVYIAPKIGWAFVDDLELSTRFDFNDFPFPDIGRTFLAEFPADGQFIFGLRLGFDLPFGDSPWSFSSSVDYTDLDPDLDFFAGDFELDPIGLDPVSIGAGVAYSF